MRTCTQCQDVAVNGSKCRVHYNEYMRDYNLERYHRIRNEAVESLGGQCVDCGSRDNLEFDHIDSRSKAFSIGRLLNVSKAKREEELTKCQLLCKLCHIAKGDEFKDQSQVDHGQGLSGKKNCPCSLCKERKAEYMKNYASGAC